MTDMQPSQEEIDQFIKVIEETQGSLSKLISEQRNKLAISEHGVHVSILANFCLNISVAIAARLLEETSRAIQQPIKKTTGIFLALLRTEMQARHPDDEEQPNPEPKH